MSIDPFYPPVRLLLVEDNPDDANLIALRLRRAGIPVEPHVVSDAEALDAALSERRWDLVVSDFAMPGYDGLRAAARVREVDPELPFIFVSGALGEERAAEAMRAGVRDFIDKGNLARLVAVVERELDTSHQRNRARRILEASRRQAHHLLAAIRVPVAALSEQGEVVAANQACVEAFGVADATPAGSERAVVELQAFVDRVLRATGLEGALRRVVAGGEERVDVDVQVDDALGRARSLRVDLQPLSLGDGEVRAVMTLHDETERMAMIRRAIVMQRLEAVGAVAGAMGQDLSERLASLTTQLRLVHAAVGPGVAGDELREAFATAREAGELVAQLQTFARSDSATASEVSVGRVVSELGPMLVEALAPGRRLTLDIQPQLGSVRCAPERLQQVIVNLVFNARDASPTGGTVAVAAWSQRVRDRVVCHDGARLQPGRYVCIRVSDEGHGIAARDLRRVCEPYFTTRRGQDGLGLSLAYGIVRAAGGNLQIQSEPHVGTHVTVHLPANAQSQPVQPRSRTGGLVARLAKDFDVDPA